MENLGLQPSCHTYNGIIKAVASRGSFGNAIGVVSSATIITSRITCFCYMVFNLLFEQTDLCGSSVQKFWPLKFRSNRTSNHVQFESDVRSSLSVIWSRVCWYSS